MPKPATMLPPSTSRGGPISRARVAIPAAPTAIPIAGHGAELPEDRADAMYHLYDGGGVTASGPAVPPDRPISLVGISWIVNAYEEGGVVIAIEITAGAAVAGPFDIPQSTLEAMIARVLARPQTPASSQVPSRRRAMIQ